MVEVARDEVDPTLVDEQSLVDRDPALAPQPFGPPGEELVGPAGHRDEPEIEDAGQANRLLARQQAVARHGARRVRRQHDRVEPGLQLDLVERREHLDVGIEVAHDFVGLEQPLQQPGLHRGGQLGDVVDRRHVVELARLDVEVAGPDDVEELQALVDLVVLVVEHEHRQLGNLVEQLERGREHPRLGEVVPRDDRADPHELLGVRVGNGR